ncbi:glycosyltransferase family 2 protein [Humitalea sp. 24SJ18S-53]|uniref:glycosyltransferase family 2 protein n=1 Tax=Humitalea sp. 24SJ18S-53 TaxID=3422307 RepID=UPI003D66951C
MPGTPNPAVTVLMPVRDGAAHLAAAVESILGQSFGDFELLVVDDGSRDATPAILARQAASDARMRVLAGPARGLVAALNWGLAEARGRHIARMDADDLAHPARLAQQLAVLEASPGVALVGSAWRVIGVDGGIKRMVMPPLDAESVAAALTRANPIAHPSVMLRAMAVTEAGSYRPAFLLAEDFDLWLRLSERHALINLAEPLLDYREHPGQAAWRQVAQRAMSEMAALAAAERRRGGAPDGADGPAPADRALLRELGLTEVAIDAGILGRALGSAKDALAARQRAAARGFIAVALRQPGLRPRTRLHLWLLRLQAALG